MNNTNRAANRLLILFSGLLLLVVGAAAAAAVLVPDLRDAWKDQTGQVTTQVSTWLQHTPLGDTGVSWIMPSLLVLAVIAIILLIVFIARQGHGHTSIAVKEPTSEHGTTVIESAMVEHTLQDTLSSHPEFLATHVSTYRVKRTPVLKISITCRRGVSPKDAATIVEDTVHALDVLLGRSLPALVQISGGFRARVTSTTRLQ